MNFIYNTGICFYQLAIFIASFFNRKAALLRKGQKAAFDLLKNADPKASYVWFHAASLGEFEQGRPVMEQLKKDDPSIKILLTFFSPSGYEVRRNYTGADLICYLPLDTAVNVRRFLKTISISKAVFVKYEFCQTIFWPWKKRIFRCIVFRLFFAKIRFSLETTAVGIGNC